MVHVGSSWAERGWKTPRSRWELHRLVKHFLRISHYEKHFKLFFENSAAAQFWLPATEPAAKPGNSSLPLFTVTKLLRNTSVSLVCRTARGRASCPNNLPSGRKTVRKNTTKEQTNKKTEAENKPWKSSKNSRSSTTSTLTTDTREESSLVHFWLITHPFFFFFFFFNWPMN